MPFPDVHRLPESRSEWQAAAYAAAGLLMIDGARKYGFVKGGPEIDVARCEELLVLAAAQDVIVDVDEATEAGLSFFVGWNEEPPDA